MAPRSTYPPEARLRRKAEFDRVFDEGVRAAGRGILLIGRAAEGASRLGVPCGRRFSKRAVDRNRFRRLVREAFRLERARWPKAIDLVVLPRAKPGALDLATLRAEIERLLPVIVRKLEARGTSANASGPADAESAP